jgi:non-ribosomal peptide synthetase component F
LKNKGQEDVALVAVRFDPNVDLIVSLLAILKAGFSYLPIAPDWPEERIKYLIQDAKPLAILTNKKDYNNSKIDIIHFESLDTRGYSNENLQPHEMYNGNSKDTYAVMYTSGSSGLPKGKLLFFPNHSQSEKSFIWNHFEH